MIPFIGTQSLAISSSPSAWCWSASRRGFSTCKSSRARTTKSCRTRTASACKSCMRRAVWSTIAPASSSPGTGPPIRSRSCPPSSKNRKWFWPTW